ncbi:MAG: hypothetical protein ACXACF_11530 [Candidatus Hermodarchaeia archaeon]|jgi:hypothetical protein
MSLQSYELNAVAASWAETLNACLETRRLKPIGAVIVNFLKN